MTDEERVRDASLVGYGELPELTRTLRALGSARRSGGSMQSQFFLPLVDARRRAAECTTPADCISAFDAGELRRQLDQALERIIARWPDERPSVRRALRAELFGRVRQYTEALERLADRADAAHRATEEQRLDSWRGWITELAATFDAADRSWMSLRSVVDVLPMKAEP